MFRCFRVVKNRQVSKSRDPFRQQVGNFQVRWPRRGDRALPFTESRCGKSAKSSKSSVCELASKGLDRILPAIAAQNARKFRSVVFTGIKCLAFSANSISIFSARNL